MPEAKDTKAKGDASQGNSTANRPICTSGDTGLTRIGSTAKIEFIPNRLQYSALPQLLA